MERDSLLKGRALRNSSTIQIADVMIHFVCANNFASEWKNGKIWGGF